VNLQVDRPLAIFDLETTGTDVARDKVVDICILRVCPGGKDAETFGSLVHPERSIPAEATAVHGIGDEDVVDAPSFPQLAAELVKMFDGADLAGFNVLAFDIPLLTAEFQRCGIAWPEKTARVVDAHLIYKRKQPHDLASAVRLFARRFHDGAHRAQADVMATLDVLDGELAMYPELPRGTTALAEWCATKEPGFVDFDGKLRWRGGEAVFTFGKVQGLSLREVAKNDRGFLEWMVKKDFSTEVKSICLDALKGRFPTPEKS
jgi:DNA polymerase-3 subunit epsilon